MSTVKNGWILLCCHFNKIIKRSGTSFQSPALSPKHVRNVIYIGIYTGIYPSLLWYYLGFKRNKHKCNFHYIAVAMMTSQILKSLEKSQEWNTSFSSNEKISCASKASLW